MNNVTKTIGLIILTLLLVGSTALASKIEVEAQYDLKLAFDYANNNNIDTLVLITSGGLYTTTDTLPLPVLHPMVLMAKEGLPEKPIIAHNDANGDEIDCIRIFDDFTVEGIIFDGGLFHGSKYALRFDNSTEFGNVKPGSNIIVKDCEFRNFFEGNDPNGDGHAFKIGKVRAGIVHFENCNFKNTGYEAIRISDTEKWATDRSVDELIVRNCTFTNIDAECVRYYSDTDPATPDAPVLVEHLTIDNSATRVVYLKNSGGAITRDLLITNSRLSGHGRDDDLLDCQGNTGVLSYVSHIDTFNVKPVPIKSTDGVVDTTTIYGFDPLYTDPTNWDYHLLPNSPAYGKAYSGNALGDLRWADPTIPVEEPQSIQPVNFTLEQNYPNPFNPSTTIQFSLNRLQNVKLKIFDITGKHVATLVNAPRGAGLHTVTWNAKDFPSGVYFYRLETDGKISETRKMVLMK
ncbi:MAG: hypothetical protein Kow0037_15810 [Calditrichia bacterium]